MKLSDPSFLNMDKILKNLSDFMKKSHPRDAESQGEQKPENGTTMAEINFARESARKKGRNAAPSCPKFQKQMRHSGQNILTRRRGCDVTRSEARLAHIVPNLIFPRKSVEGLFC